MVACESISTMSNLKTQHCELHAALQGIILWMLWCPSNNTYTKEHDIITILTKLNSVIN